MIKKINTWKIFTAICLILLIASIATNGFKLSKGLSKNDAKEIADEFIKNNLISQGVSISIDDITEQNNLYLLDITVSSQGQTQNVKSYITKDGKLFFPQAIDIAEFQSASTQSDSTQQQTPQDIPKTDKPVVELYVMAFCPYGMQAENAMDPVLNLLGDKADVEIHFIAGVTGTTPESVQSLHGTVEAQEDLRQICIMNYYDQETFWRYLMIINANCSSKYRDSSYEVCWKDAAEQSSIDVDKIITCSTGSEGINLLKTDTALAEQKQVSGSPTLFINDVLYNGARTSEAYKQSICNAFSTEPSECIQELSSAATTASGNCGT